MKKIIISLIAFATLALIGAFIYLVTNNSGPAADVTNEGGTFPSGNNGDSTGIGRNGVGTGGGSLFPEASTTVTVNIPFPTNTDNPSREARRVGDMQVISATTFGTIKGVNLTTRFVEAGSGNIWDYRPLGSESKRVSATTIPRVKEVIWSIRGEFALLRYLDENAAVVKNYSIKVPTSTSAKVEGYFLPDNLITAVPSPTDNKLFYLAENKAGGTDGFLTTFANGKTITLFTSPFGEWQISWPLSGSLIITTKTSNQVFGNYYSKPASGGSYSLFATAKPLLNNIKGLTALSNPSLEKVIYSQSGPKSFSTRFLNVKTNESRDFPLITFPIEKCVWDKIKINIAYCAAPREKLTGGQPDLWYKGLVTFTDNIYRVDTDSDTVTLLYSPTIEGPDVSQIIVSEDSSFLFFINRKDSSLWAL